MYSRKKDSTKARTARKKEGRQAVETKKEDDLRQVEESLFSDVDLPKKKEESNDEEIGLIEKERPKKQEKRSFSISDGSSPSEMRQIIIRFNPRIMERAAYIGAIVILLLLVTYFATTSGSAPANEDMVGVEDAQSFDEEEQAANPSESPPREEQQTAVEPEEDEEERPDASAPADEGHDRPDEELTAEEIEDEVPLSGDVTVTITDVQTQTTSYGGKIKSVAFIVDNGDEAFVPKVKIYVYDEESKNERLQAPTIKVFDELGSGKRLIADVKLSGALFAEDAVDTEKTVLIKLFDEGERIGYANDRLLAKAEATTRIG